MNDSRFQMWRAVVALAHADGMIAQQERSFVESYLAQLPISAQQADTLRADLQTPASPGDMFAAITVPSDRADYFQFAQMIIACDGTQAEQEKAIIDHLLADQLQTIHQADLEAGLRQGWAAARIRSSIEDQEFNRQAHETALFSTQTAATLWRGIAGLFGVTFKTVTDADKSRLGPLMSWIMCHPFEAPGPDVFAQRRAVFALATADGTLSADERDYVDAMMRVYNFSDAQRATINADITATGNIVPLFRALKTPAQRRAFFTAARSIAWSDWDFSPREKDTLRSLMTSLDPAERTSLAADLLWIDAKPDAAPASGSLGRQAS